jgi:hypothetical protein
MINGPTPHLDDSAWHCALRASQPDPTSTGSIPSTLALFCSPRPHTPVHQLSPPQSSLSLTLISPGPRSRLVLPTWLVTRLIILIIILIIIKHPPPTFSSPTTTTHIPLPSSNIRHRIGFGFWYFHTCSTRRGGLFFSSRFTWCCR